MALSWLTYRRWPLIFPCVTLAMLWIIGMTAVVEVARRNVDYYSCKGVVAAIRAERPDAQILIYGSLEKSSTAVFYAKRALPIVESTSPGLRYGQKTAGGHGLFFTLTEFLHLPSTPPHYLIVRTKVLRELQTKTGFKKIRHWKTIGHTAIYTASPETNYQPTKCNNL